MINKINNNQISDLLKEAFVKQPNGSRPAEDENADVLLQVSYGGLVEKAQHAPAEDVSAVERARHLLATGQLDTPENIRKAAENILKFGI